MKRVLFVDDERQILEGLKRMLRGQRHEWEMEFVESGPAALERMAKNSFDVIVTDMRMPGMDGARLLTRVQELCPRTVRIVLSGHAELESAMRAVQVAHQFLSKPCESAVIRDVVERACALQSLMNDSSLKELVGRIDALPALPRVYNELVAALADPEVGIPEIAPIIEQDAAITAKILQLVNSSFFGIAREIGDMRQATSFLGLNMIRNLTLSTEVFRAFKSDAMPVSFSMEAEQSHASATARLARRFLDDRAMSDNAFLAAMLHDIGKLILATKVPESYAQVFEKAAAERITIHDAELALLGVSHAEVGAYLLGIWGMPYPIVEAVANHHRPARVQHSEPCVLTAVHVADCLAHELYEGARGQGGPPPARIDLDYLHSVGMQDDIQDWRARAAEVLESEQSHAA